MRKRSAIVVIVLSVLLVILSLVIVAVELKTGRTIFTISEWINFFITYLSFCGTMILGLVSYTLAKKAYDEEQILTKKIALQPIISTTITVTQKKSFGFIYDKAIDVDASLFMVPTEWIVNAKAKMPDDFLKTPTAHKTSNGEFEVIPLCEKLQKKGMLADLQEAYFEFNLCKLTISFQMVSLPYPCLVELESVRMTTFAADKITTLGVKYSNNSNDETFRPFKKEPFYPDLDTQNIWNMPIDLAMPSSRGIFDEEGLLRFRRGFVTEEEFKKCCKVDLHIHFNINIL